MIPRELGTAIPPRLPGTCSTDQRFRPQADACDDARRGMLSARGRPNIVVGGPPEFRGGPDIWAPEELPVGSLNTYMMLTFLTLAHARGLTPVGYESEAKLEPARKTMEGVEAQCFIANSVKARVALTPEFVVAPPPK
jgi:organic hydroperoxide reductase OsmC/OhrA